MRITANISTVATLAVPQDRYLSWMLLCNTSDATLFVDFTGEGASPVSPTNGIPFAPGEKISLTGPLASASVSAIHAGVGLKTLVIQGL